MKVRHLKFNVIFFHGNVTEAGSADRKSKLSFTRQGNDKNNMCEAEPLCAENIGLKDIARSHRGELISRGELIMYYSVSCSTLLVLPRN